MICAPLNRELGLAFRSFLGFLDRSLGFAMGCFFVCLRARDGGGGGGRRHLPQSARPRKAAVSCGDGFVELGAGPQESARLFDRPPLGALLLLKRSRRAEFALFLQEALASRNRLSSLFLAEGERLLLLDHLKDWFVS